MQTATASHTPTAEGASQTLHAVAVQELICSGEALPVVLRLLVLVTLAAGGVPKRYYDTLRREVLHTYGHEHISTLTRLQEAGAQPALRPHAASGERFPSETGYKQLDTSPFSSHQGHRYVQFEGQQR